MTDEVHYLFEADLPVNKSRIKTVYTIGLVLFIISVVCVVWSHFNWDEYTYLVQDVITGEVSRTGIASVLYYWGLGFGIAIPVIYGLMWFSVDFKNPALGVNKQGVFINQEGFKKAFLKWEDFERMEKKENGDLRMYMKDPASIVKQQPAATRPFLTQTFVKDKSPITLSASEKAEKIIELIVKYSGKV